MTNAARMVTKGPESRTKYASGGFFSARPPTFLVSTSIEALELVTQASLSNTGATRYGGSHTPVLVAENRGSSSLSVRDRRGSQYLSILTFLMCTKYCPISSSDEIVRCRGNSLSAVDTPLLWELNIWDMRSTAAFAEALVEAIVSLSLQIGRQ